MTDFSAENRTAPNGPAPFAPRGDDAQLAGEAAPVGPAPAPAPAAAPVPPPVHANGGQRLAAAAKGRIDVADEVVEKVAGLAAIEVEGVADLGGDIERALESVRDRIGIGNKRGDQGVKAEVRGREAAVDVTIVIEYGRVVMEVARQVQTNVAVQTNRMLGLSVVEVNVTVDDVKMPKPARAGEHEGEADGGVTLDG